MDRALQLIDEAEERAELDPHHKPAEREAWPRRRRVWDLWITGLTMAEIARQVGVVERTGWRDLAAVRALLREAEAPAIRAAQLEAIAAARMAYRFAMREVVRCLGVDASPNDRRAVSGLLARALDAIELQAELAGALDRRAFVAAQVAVESPVDDWERRHGAPDAVFTLEAPTTNGGGNGTGNGDGVGG